MMEEKDKKSKLPSSITSRSAIYRIGVIHKEISMGAYPNASDLGDILEVSYKTILRDIKIMREQFDFPIAYHPVLKGFFYDITDEQNLDILYWQSIFARMANGDITKPLKNKQNKIMCSCLNAFLQESDEKLRALLEKVVKTITLGGCIYLKKNSAKRVATPIYFFKKMGQWFMALTVEYDGSYISVDISKCTLDENSHLLVDMNDSEPLASISLSASGACNNYPKNASVCMCSRNGVLHTCSSIKDSKVFIVSGDNF